jgi:hypothetical protein
MEGVVAHLFSLIFHSFHPSEADYLVPEQFSFYGVNLLVSRPTPQSLALKPHHHDKVETPSVGTLIFKKQKF